MRLHLILAIAAASFSSSALAAWPALFTGPGSQLDVPTKIATDSEGNVVICGYNFSGANSDFMTLKYDRTGKLLWTRYYGSPDVQETGNAVAVDPAGNIYVTGGGKGTNDFDVITVKYDKNGVQKWVRTLSGPDGSYNSPNAISFTAKGKVVIAGYQIIGSDYGLLTAQYSSSGSLDWSTTYSSPGDHNENVDALAVDPAGNIFLAGRLYGDGTDFGVLKYNRLGVLQWVRQLKGDLSEGTDAARAIAVDSNSDVVAFGSLQGSSGLSDYLTVKFSQSGQKLWQVKGGSPSSDELGAAMRIDALDNILVTGNRSVSGGSDILTIKYDSAGIRLWQKVYEGLGGSGSNDAAKGIEVADDGTVFVGVQLAMSDFTSRFAMVKYSSTGKRISVKVNGYTDTYSSTPYAMAVDATQGRAYLTGTTYNPDSVSYDIYTVRY